MRRPYRSGTAWCCWRWTDVETGHIRRLHLIKTPLFAVCLHWLFAADPEPHEHDHPVSFLSIVLRGAYVEVRDGRAFARTRFNFIRATDRHRIHWAHPTTLTLCLMGPKVREWGFHTPSGWVCWRDYYRRRRMPESETERRLEQAAPAGSPDPLEQDSDRQAEAERQIAETEAEENRQ